MRSYLVNTQSSNTRLTRRTSPHRLIRLTHGILFLEPIKMGGRKREKGRKRIYDKKTLELLETETIEQETQI